MVFIAYAEAREEGATFNLFRTRALGCQARVWGLPTGRRRPGQRADLGSPVVAKGVPWRTGTPKSEAYLAIFSHSAIASFDDVSTM